MTRRVEVVGDPASEPGWDAFVRTHPSASTYHLAAWARIIRGAYGSRPRAMVLRSADGALAGVLPLFAHRGVLSGSRLSSIPVGRVAGPLGVDRDAEVALVAAARDASDALGLRQLVVRSHVGGLERDVGGLLAADDQPTWVVPLAAGVDEARARLRRGSANVHRGIARAAKAGVRVREGRSDADLRAFHRLYAATMRRHRALPRVLRQFRLEREALGDEFVALLAEHGGAVVAAGVFHRFGDTFELLYNGSDEAALDVRPNHALYWHAIERALAHGCSRFDMGGALPGTSLGEFKRRWGAEPVAIHRYTHHPGRPDEGGRTAPPGGVEVGGRSALVARVWTRAPLAVHRAAGAVAYRLL